MKSWIFLLALLTGCTLRPLHPGKSSFASPSGFVGSLKQSENPQTQSSQVYQKVTRVEPAIKLPQDQVVTTTETITTTIGAAQKDTAREIGAKLASLKGVVWVGIVVFLFGAASAFYPPLKLIVGSTTTSAMACVAGLILIILPSLVVGHEILIMSVACGAVLVYWFAHRHGELRGTVTQLKQ